MELIIYHGSKDIIKNPIYGKGKPYNDYGLGFYCTEDINLAKEWAVDEDNNGYANKYKIDMTDLNILDLSDKKYTVLHWITLLLKNRVFNLKNEISKEGKKYLINNFSIDISKYDIIKGYRADDSYFSYAESFLNNIISIRQLSEAMKLGDLGEQIVLISKKAFEKIEYIDNEIAESNIYFPLRSERNENARKKFLSSKQSSINKDDIFLFDLIRERIDLNDSRIQ